MSDQEWEELANEFPDSFIALEWRLHVACGEIFVALGGKHLRRFLLWVTGTNCND